MQTTAHYSLIFCLACLLSACGGGGGGGDVAPDVGGGDDSERPPSYGLLKPVESDAELADSLRAGVQGSSYVSATAEELLVAVPAEGDLSAESSSAGSRSFSTTNLQEAGVDEADIVKYDGAILYLVDYNEPDYFPLQLVEPQPGLDAEVAAESAADAPLFVPEPPTIRLLRTDPTVPSTEDIAEISLGSPDYRIDGLYLAGSAADRHLIAVGQSNPFVYWERFASDYFWREGSTLVQSWDVSTPENPASDWSLELDGSLLASRRVDNILYLVTRYSPFIEGLVAYPQTEQEVAANQALIEATAVQSLLPEMRRDNGVSEELLTATDCYVPNQDFDAITAPPAGGSLVTVTAIDLDAPATLRSVCLNTYASGFYVATGALYVTANVGDATLIHKIGLSAQGPQYRGSGAVRGYIGTSNPSFLMSEFDGDLRVVSSTWEGRFFPLPVLEAAADDEDPQQQEQDDSLGRHRLTVLRESADGTRLEEIARLPNAGRPAAIGKPEEDIYAARFLGDRAYIVTFQLIDPLYVLDLADPQDPRIAGELEIPGFSTLLQPLGENLLLGVGMEVPVAGPNLTQGVKLALFDVADVAAPVSLAEVVIGKRGSYSPALDNHHSLTLLELDGHYRAAVPVQRHAAEQEQGIEIGDPWYYYGWSDNGLYLFDIDPALGTLRLSDSLIVERSSAEQPYSYSGLYNSRSVLHDEAVFFVNNGSVWSQLWEQ